MQEFPNVKILWLTDRYYPSMGGMAISCDRIVYNLRKSGIYIELIHFSTAESEFRREMTMNGAYICCTAGDDCGDSAMRLWMTFGNAWKNMEFSHVVIFGGIYSMVCGSIFSKWLDTRLVTLIRGNDFDSSIMSPRKQGYLLNALKESSRIAVVSNDKKMMIEKLLPESKVYWIPNGIDCKNWQMSPHVFQQAARWRAKITPHDKLVVLIIGHLKSKKGVPFFLRSCKVAGLTERIIFVLTGHCDTATEEFISNNQDIPIFREEQVFHEQVITRYLGVDYVAIPSFYDGMPNVLLEAAACKKPVIASCCGGMADVVRNKIHGFLFEPGNLASAGAILHQAVNTSGEMRDAMGTNLYNEVASLFTVEKETQSYRELFS